MPMTDPTRAYYSLEYGSYYLRDPTRTLSDERGAIVRMVDQVTVAYSCKDDEWTMHKHGELEDVRTWWQKNRETALPLFGEIQLITFPPKFSADRINDIIEVPARIKQLLAEVEGEVPVRVLSTWDWLSQKL